MLRVNGWVGLLWMPNNLKRLLCKIPRGKDMTSQLNASYSQVLSLHLNFVFGFFWIIELLNGKVNQCSHDSKWFMGPLRPWGNMTGGSHDTFGLVEGNRNFTPLGEDPWDSPISKPNGAKIAKSSSFQGLRWPFYWFWGCGANETHINI